MSAKGAPVFTLACQGGRLDPLPPLSVTPLLMSCVRSFLFVVGRKTIAWCCPLNDAFIVLIHWR